MAVPKVRFGVGPKLELPTLLSSRRVDPHSCQPLQMVASLTRINDVNRLVATLEPVLNERKQHAILFIVAVEKRTDMTCSAELGARKGNGYRDPPHGLCLSLYRPLAAPVVTPLKGARSSPRRRIWCQW